MISTLKDFPHIEVPLFCCGEIVFCNGWQMWSAIHDLLDADPGSELCNGASRTFSSNEGVLHIIGLFNGENSTLAHECAHMAFDICSRVGVDIEQGGANETFCHLVSRLVHFCEQQMKKPE